MVYSTTLQSSNLITNGTSTKIAAALIREARATMVQEKEGSVTVKGSERSNPGPPLTVLIQWSAWKEPYSTS
jgi:hypothetical protein